MEERTRGASIWTQLQTFRSDRYSGVGRWDTYTAEGQRQAKVKSAYIQQRVGKEGTQFLEDINHSPQPGVERRQLDELALRWAGSLRPRQRRTLGI